MQANVLSTLSRAASSNGLSYLSSSDQTYSTNITAQLRQIVSILEQMIATNLYEGEVYSLKNGVLNISITKYSRSANLLYDLVNQDNANL